MATDKRKELCVGRAQALNNMQTDFIDSNGNTRGYLEKTTFAGT